MDISKKNFFYSVIIFLLPLIYFLESNHKNFNFEYYFVFFILVLSTIIFSIVFGIIFIRFFNDTDLSKFLLTSIFYFIMIVFFGNLYNYFDGILFKNKGEIVFLISFSLFLIIVLSSKINKFFVIFSLTIFLISIIKIFVFEINKKISIKKDNYIINFENYKIQNNKDIYIIIFDAAISLEEFDKIYKLNTKKEFLNNLPYKYIYHKNIKPLANNSGEAIKKILNFNRINKIDNSNKFPEILTPKNFINTDIKKFIDINNFDFYFFGNSTVNCSSHNIKLCFDVKVEKKTIYFFYMNEVLDELYKYSFFKMLKKKVLFTLNIDPKINNKILKMQHELNIPLSDYSIKKFNNNKNNMFLFYNYLPHEPYFYDKNCGYKKIKINEELNYYDGYKDNYLCMIKSIKIFLNKISKNPKNSNIIILADHGFPLISAINNKKGNIDINQDIFLISNNYENCAIELNSKKQNVKTILLQTLKC